MWETLPGSVTIDAEIYFWTSLVSNCNCSQRYSFDWGKSPLAYTSREQKAEGQEIREAIYLEP